MKISGGKYRGKTLLSPKSGAVRPTSDRMREAVFNILRSKLGFNFTHMVFFDVFAGSGAMGLEALSQGFEKIVFFDVDLSSVLRNINLFPNDKNSLNTVGGDILKAQKQDCLADVMFMDAPYLKGLTELALDYLAKGEFLKKNALCLIEVEKNEKCNLPSQYELLDERKYGLARLIIAKFRA